MAYMLDVLSPRAVADLQEASLHGRDPNDQAVQDEVAQTLFKIHRGGHSQMLSNVQERSWEKIPNSEKGKYRKIVMNALPAVLKTRVSKRR